jgi:hypothetical protein
MKSLLLSTIFAAAIVAIGLDQGASAGGHRGGNKVPAPTWHGGYYEAEWGMPLPVVVPPKAEMQVHYGWGVGATRTTPIGYQYEAGYPIPGYYNRTWFQPVPLWPTDTDQLGKYYIRGPW